MSLSLITRTTSGAESGSHWLPDIYVYGKVFVGGNVGLCFVRDSRVFRCKGESAGMLPLLCCRGLWEAALSLAGVSFRP